MSSLNTQSHLNECFPNCIVGHTNPTGCDLIPEIYCITPINTLWNCCFHRYILADANLLSLKNNGISRRYNICIIECIHLKYAASWIRTNRCIHGRINRIKYKIFPSSQEGSSWPLPKNFISQDNHGLVSPDLELCRIT